jgi:trigger factor
MNILRTDIDAVNALITIQVSEADYKERVEKSLKDYRKKANIPGFRPGFAPVGLVKKMYGRGILADEVNKLLQESLYKYIDENKIDVLGEPLPNETEQAEINFDTDKDFEFKFDLAIAPEFEITLNKKDSVKYYDIEVTDEMIDNQVKNYASRFGNYTQTEETTEKDVLKGNILELKKNGSVNEEGIKVEDAVISPAYIKDAKQKATFIGAKKDSTVVFNPQKAFENDAEISSMLKISKEEAKNITSDFSFEIQTITHYEESAIDQSLFDKVYGEGTVKSEDEFKTKVKEDIKDAYSQDSDYKFGIDARALLIKKMDKLTFPETFLKRWVLATNENMTEETVDKDFNLMLEDLKWYLAKNKIAKANDLKVDKDDVDAFARKLAKIQFAQYGMTSVPDDILDNFAKDMLKKQETARNVFEKALEEKIFAIVKESVKLNIQEISVEKFNKLFE